VWSVRRVPFLPRLSVTMPEDIDANDVLRALLNADLISVGYDFTVDDFFFYLDDEQQKRMDEVDESTWSDY